MLDTLRRIVQEVNDAKDLNEALDIIVLRVKNAMNVDLCSVYLVDHIRNQNVLAANCSMGRKLSLVCSTCPLSLSTSWALPSVGCAVVREMGY